MWRRWLVSLMVISILLLALPAGADAAGPGIGRVVYFAFPRGQLKWLLPVTVLVPDDFTQVRATLEALCQGPPAEGILDPVLPLGTRVRSIDLGATTTVDFNRQLAAVKGARAEQLAVQAIVHTLCQFATVEKVKITVEGEVLATLAGHVRIDQPLVCDPAALFAGYPDTRGEPEEGVVLALTVRGILAGYPDGTFRPRQPITRGEALKSLVESMRSQTGGRLRALSVTSPPREWFSDVGRGHWLLPYLQEAVREGVVSAPRRGDRFRPDEPLLAGEMALWGLPAQGEITEKVSRGAWALLMARYLNLGGPDVYVSWPVSSVALEGQALVVGTARWSQGTMRVAIVDSRGITLAGHQLRLEPRGEGWSWFAERLQFRRPLTPGAGMVEVRHSPPEGTPGVENVVQVPVFIR